MLNVSMIQSGGRKLGLSTSDIKVLCDILKVYFDRLPEIYDGRTGTIVLDSQAIVMKPVEKGARPSIRNLTYGDACRVMQFDFPSGPSKNIFFNSEKVAAEAIDSLLKGKRFFTGHANASLNGNIYKTSGSNHTHESGHLMILNTMYGRFLVGCGDAFADSDKRRESDYIFIAIARIIAKLFPKDEEIQASFDWIRRASNLDYYLCDTIIGQIDRIFEERPRFLHEYYWHRDNEPDGSFIPFT